MPGKGAEVTRIVRRGVTAVAALACAAGFTVALLA
jgi:hypothetical protein